MIKRIAISLKKEYWHQIIDGQKPVEFRKYAQYTEGYPFTICHGWQLNREEAQMFTAQFWDRWEAMTKIISSFNYDKSESMVDYFDVGFYERWEILPAKKAA